MATNEMEGTVSVDLPNGDVKIKEHNGLNVGRFYFKAGDMKENKAFIKSVEKIVRTSEEYSKYLGLLHNIGLNNDVMMPNVNMEMATLEFHHYPLSLYDITEIIFNKNLKKKVDFTSYSLAEEIIGLHYKSKIGLALLSKTNHDLMHAGKLFLPLDSVYGDVNGFVEEYKPYMFPDQFDKINILVDATENGPENINLPDLDAETPRIEMASVFDEDKSSVQKRKETSKKIEKETILKKEEDKIPMDNPFNNDGNSLGFL